MLLSLTIPAFRISTSFAAPARSLEPELKTRDGSSSISRPIFLTYYDDYKGTPVPEVDKVKVRLYKWKSIFMN